MSSTIALPRHHGPDGALGGPWRVIVRNDSHNTFDHVAASLARVLPGVTLQRGYKFADDIHQRGLAVVWSGHRELAEHYWEALRALGLTMAPLEEG
jgi:ATP-dependent Clp protease adaptor protein ClpS